MEQADTGKLLNIVILATSDLHGNLWGYRYEDSRETENDGMARVASYVKEVRDSGAAVILIDNGDVFQGNMLTDDIYNKRTDTVHPVSAVLNAMGYAAMTLGNHEFNFGLDLIAKFRQELDFPVLAANAAYPGGELFAEPYTLIEVQGVRVAVIGLTNPNIPRWDAGKVEELRFGHMAETAQQLAASLRAEDKADIIVISAHAGMVAEFDEEGGSDSAEQIARLVPEADVLLVGHMHITVKQRIGDIVIGGPRDRGREVVRFDLTVQLEGAGPRVVNREVSIADMAGWEPDPEFRKLAAEAHEETIRFSGQGGGALAAEADGSILGYATADFQPQAETGGIPAGRLQDTPVITLIQKVMLQASGADVAATSLFSDTADLKQGPLTYADVYRIYPFDNVLYVVTVTGKELKAYMEASATHFNQWQPGDLEVTANPEVPSYLYDMFAGIDYQIDLSQPAGQRIINVLYQGQALADTQQLQLAVNNYRYSSLLKASRLVSAARHWESPCSVRDMLVSYIRGQGTLSPEADNNWSITGVGN
ncbi:5'-nucleotidase C-terminal domain-containing protein [Paenibacillus sp. MMS20-IR301]|uniref:bifunctional metallophosphatase/5'-nucleotidase n=1 Tax=Paenibacillus sp. MMS20-IR301 TaxID=2895946 RepID=UPI0028E60C82|nr:5'-nucleotidase C-terminal domain-containing protein [Paenibacillus sp. MMS20-IR301]WNS41547.1 5'-nucleotidase C-terminal domain-containing protein [Paenibacillus sp. MMS20-IR301]